MVLWLGREDSWSDEAAEARGPRSKKWNQHDVGVEGSVGQRGFKQAESIFFAFPPILLLLRWRLDPGALLTGKLQGRKQHERKILMLNTHQEVLFTETHPKCTKAPHG